MGGSAYIRKNKKKPDHEETGSGNKKNSWSQKGKNINKKGTASDEMNILKI